jgi:dihydrodipicolinate synthase/N-acetylneuraminate lyase
MKTRYHDHLYRIDEKDMKKIVNWIEKEGLDGFLIFDES